ncbi:MAG TPA: LysR family transcriptional regulator [Victivallales bacterium]|nr:LysR family transcriptional regulator [Victivallales bacterium]
MKLSSVNLNLLAVLDALLSVQNVSKAAKKIGLSQPQVSNILKELRIIFNDELLSRGPKNQMFLTQKAHDLIEPVREAVEKCKDIFIISKPFDPYKAELNFTIGMNDYASALLLPDIVELTQSQSPASCITVVPLNSISEYQIIYSNDIDLIIGHYNIQSNNIISEHLFDSELCCIVSENHPILIKKQISGKDLIKYPFVQAQLANDYWLEFGNLIDNEFGEKRKIIATVPHILVAISMLSNSEYICITHKRLASKFSQQFKIKTFDLPFKIPVPAYSMFWKKVDNLNKENIFLRDLIKKTVGGYIN